MRNLAIRALYPNVVTIDEEAGAFDVDNNPVAVDEDAIAAKILELQPEQNLKRLRQERDLLIAQTDWWASSDLTMTQEQIDYRQALRDITNTYTSLDDVVWPTKPE